VEVLGGKNDVKLSVDLLDVALADLAGNDFQDEHSSVMGGVDPAPART
jgi:hypothetical protein